MVELKFEPLFNVQFQLVGLDTAAAGVGLPTRTCTSIRTYPRLQNDLWLD